MSSLINFLKVKAVKKSDFLLAGRVLPTGLAAISIASSWIWAPALFLSSQKAYQDGLVGFFWFLFPNVLTLVLFSFFASKLRQLLPFGYTITSYMRERYGRKVYQLYLLQNFGLLTACLAVQMVGGAKILSLVSPFSFHQIVVGLSLLSLSYSIIFGLRASVLTDVFKILILIILLVTGVPSIISAAGGWPTLFRGLSGASGVGLHFFSKESLNIFLTFGLPTSIGLLSGPFGDQAFYQRTFAILKNNVRNAFLIGAIVFAVVPISFSILGFLVAGNKIVISDPGLVNYLAVQTFLPSWTWPLFALVVALVLLSAMDTHMAALGSIAGHDFLKQKNPGDITSLDEDKKSRQLSRYSILGGTLVAMSVASIPNMQILYLFLFYGTFRSSTFLPTVLSVLSKNKWTCSSVFWGILSALCVGLPTFIYGTLNNIIWCILIGSLSTVLIPALIMYLSIVKTE